MQIQSMKIDEVKPYPNNPRNNDDGVEAVANSIKEFGWQQPIVVDKDNVIIVGHTRYKAAKKLGMDKVPVVVADGLSPEQVKAYRLADNKTGELTDWDMGLLDDELADIADIDMSDFGFDLDLGDDEAKVQEDDFDEEVPEEPKSKLGQIYQLGRHRLMCGDSTKAEDVKKLVGGVQCDLLLTDPPYGIDYQGRTKDKLRIQNDSLDDSDFIEFLAKALDSAKNVLKRGSSIYMWYSQVRSLAFYAAMKKAQITPKQQLVWVKSNITMGKPYRNKYEPCIFATLSKDYCWYSDNSQPTVMNFDNPKKNRLHPTMKPVALFDYQIKNSTKSGDAVLDLFGGSGTTIMACEQDGRNACVMEYDPKYVDVIIKRWEDFTGKKAELVED
ncbi:MAG: ParB N-terminal domain-containing protein [Lactobacillus sp.]|nr:ParB N-terminal domain-containing protein [Lactobacillus sp.]